MHAEHQVTTCDQRRLPLASQGTYLFREFVHHEAAGRILLLLCAIIALKW